MTELEKREVKINELNRYLFPSLSMDLEKNGQLQPVLIDEDGIIHDGAKRILLCGLDQLNKKIVPKDSECSNIHYLTMEQKKILITSILSFDKIQYGKGQVQKLSKRYGVGMKTIYRWINGESKENKKKKRKPREKNVETIIKVEKLSKLEMIKTLNSWIYVELEEAPVISEDEMKELRVLKDGLNKWVGD